MNRDPISRLLDLAERTGADWLAEAVERHLSGEPIAEALELAGDHRRPTARRDWLLQRRDEHLRAAWRAVQGATGPTARTLALHRECRRVESLWPGIGHLRQPPERFSPVRRHVWHAMHHASRAGGGLPKFRQLHTICSR
jgi:hypothetical protein